SLAGNKEGHREGRRVIDLGRKGRVEPAFSFVVEGSNDAKVTKVAKRIEPRARTIGMPVPQIKVGEEPAGVGTTVGGQSTTCRNPRQGPAHDSALGPAAQGPETLELNG